MTLRTRLSLAYLVLLAVCLSAFGVGVYTYVDTRLHADLYSSVQREATDMASFATTQPTEPEAINFLQQTANKLPPNFWVIASEENIGNALGPSYAFLTTAFRPEDANRIVAAVNIGRPAVLQSAITPDHTPWVADAQAFVHPGARSGQGGQSTTGPQFAGEVVVGESLAPLYASLQSLRVVLIAGGIVTLLIATLIGLALAGTLLAPLERMRRAVQQIAHDRDFGRRVPAGARHDEIGRLSQSFNEMLAELERSHADLQGALDSQRRFVADASHELRTPLTAIRTNVEFVARVPAARNEDRSEALSDALAEMDRIEDLVADLLALARLEGARTPRIPVRMDELLDDVRHDAARRARSSVEVRMPAPPRCWVAGDHDYLRRAVWNLVDNALKYTTSGHVDLALELRDGWCDVRVRDTGIGIAESDLPFLFDRFWRAPAVRGTAGSGLGLAITNWVAHAHGGSLTVQSVLGRGSTFTLGLPTLAEKAVPRADKPKNAAPAPQPRVRALTSAGSAGRFAPPRNPGRDS